MFFNKKETMVMAYNVGDLYITDLSALNIVAYDSEICGYKDIYGKFLYEKEGYFKNVPLQNQTTIILELEEKDGIKYFKDFLTDIKIFPFAACNESKSDELGDANVDYLSAKLLYGGIFEPKRYGTNIITKRILSINEEFLSVYAGNIKPISEANEKEKESLYDYMKEENLNIRESHVKKLLERQREALKKIADNEAKRQAKKQAAEQAKEEMDNFKKDFQSFHQKIKAKKARKF